MDFPHIYVLIYIFFPIIVTLSILSLRVLNKVTKSLLYIYLFGVLLSTIWEIPIHIAGSRYITYEFDNQLGHWSVLLNCAWDSIIFIIGLLAFNRINNGYIKLVGLIVWCIVQQFLTQYITNGNYSIYNTDNQYNRTIITVRGITYTCMPFIIWISMSILYLSGALAIIEKYGTLIRTRVINFGNSNTSLYNRDNSDLDNSDLDNIDEIVSVI